MSRGPCFKSLRVSYFLFVPLRSFFLCYPNEALEGPISTVVCKNLAMLIQITTYRYEKLLCYVYICMYVCMYVYMYIYVCIYYFFT